jgi:TM2 domain-containing membrane protein YozV
VRSKVTAYLLWCLCFVGLCGIHRFYAGKWVSGLIWLFTGGLLFIGQIVDLFLIPGMIDVTNLETKVDAMEGK